MKQDDSISEKIGTQIEAFVRLINISIDDAFKAIEELSLSYNDLLDQIKDLKERVKDLEKRIKNEL